MSEENHEVIDSKVEDNTVTEERLETIEEPQAIEESVIDKESNIEVDKKVSFNDSFMANLIDAMIMAGISIAGLLILDNVILKILGYKVVVEYKGTMLLLIFALVTILYPAIMESRNGRTIGKKVSKLKVKKVEE